MAKRLAKISEKVISPALKQRGGQFSTVLRHWPEIVGAELAKICQPLSLKWHSVEIHAESPIYNEPQSRTKNTAILIIGCNRFVALEVQHANQEILRKVNLTLGAQYVSEIRTKVTEPSSHDVPRRYTDIEKERRQKNIAKTSLKQDDWQPPEKMNPRLSQAFAKWHQNL